MAEEDLIFGKNRHMFGGIEPSNMRKFIIISKTGGAVKILASLPNDTVIDGQTLCTVGGAVIRRRTDKCPVDEFDGDLIADIKESGTIVDSTADLAKTYYYKAFPYTTQGVYNRGQSVNNKTKYSPTGAYYIYGYDLDIEDANPESRVTYPSDVDNELFEPAKMNFTGTTAEGTFSYGSWPSTAGEGFMPRPCMLYRRTSEVAYYLSQDDYTKKEDGSASEYNNYHDSNMSETELKKQVEAMMEWPKIYTKREVVNGVYKFRCAPVKVDSSYECWCNYDRYNNEIDHFYTSIYKRGTSSGPYSSNYVNNVYNLRSLSSSDKSIYTGKTATNYLSDADKYPYSDGSLLIGTNSDFTIEVLSDHLLIQDLLVMMAKTTDLKSAYGDGRTESSDDRYSEGFETKGLFYGAPQRLEGSTQTGRVKVFGMVDYWDSLYSRKLAGWINDKGTIKVKLTAGTKDGTTVTGYNVTGDGYLTIPDAYAGSGGYISDCRVESYGRIPVGYSGSKTTYECDYCSSGNQDVYFAMICGILNGSENRGPFSVTLNKEQDYASTTIAASISCKPSKT